MTTPDYRLSQLDTLEAELAAVSLHGGAKSPEEIAQLELLLSGALLSAIENSGDLEAPALLAAARQGDARAFVAAALRDYDRILGGQYPRRGESDLRADTDKASEYYVNKMWNIYRDASEATQGFREKVDGWLNRDAETDGTEEPEEPR